jgi:hypothetical protein
MALPREFRKVIGLLGQVFEDYQVTTGSRAVLVGGAAVSLYTQGRYISGDFDVVAGVDDAFGLAMQNHGFLAEDRLGHLLAGWYQPRYPNLGVQLTWGSHLSSTKFQGIESLHRLGSKVESGGIMQRPWPHQLTSGRINIRTHIPHA